MKICLLTYDHPHLKTDQIYWGLRLQGLHEIAFMEVPFRPRKEREIYFRHRPEQFVGSKGADLAALNSHRLFSFEERFDALRWCDFCLVCGANILEPEFANSGKIINGHAGLIPFVRGLDSFKWAIHGGRPVGNTLHIIDQDADRGEVLHQVATPVFQNDSLESFAARHYQIEISLLSNFHLFIDGGESLECREGDATRRMPFRIERTLREKFESYKALFA